MPSTAIAAYHYDEQSLTLRVVFITGAVYNYLKVPAKVFAAMKNATSKGGYLNRYIKGHYDFEKVN
jgi:hypothetical protein